MTVPPSLRANGSRECAPDDRLREAIRRPSFRGDAKHRTRNLEIPRCAIAHLRSGANAPSRNDSGQDAPRNDARPTALDDRKSGSPRPVKTLLTKSSHAPVAGAG